MANLKAIRKRISSVKSTQKITRAQKMVAGARLTRAQQRIQALRPYAVKTAQVLAEVAARASDDDADAVASDAEHPLLADLAGSTAAWQARGADELVLHWIHDDQLEVVLAAGERAAA